MFTALYNEVCAQVAYMDTFHPTLGGIQILVDDSKSFIKGGLSIGKKRDALLKRANGKYLCFLDDDEGIAPNYVETLVRLCQEDKDVCTFRNISKMDNFWMVVDMSIHYSINEQATPLGIVRRTPWHICPIKTEIAIKYSFTDSNYGEDYEWMERVLIDCHSEAKSDAIIHQYNHSKHTSESDKITAHVQPKQ